MIKIVKKIYREYTNDCERCVANDEMSFDETVNKGFIGIVKCKWQF